jgi:hypothetical protein
MKRLSRKPPPWAFKTLTALTLHLTLPFSAADFKVKLTTGWHLDVEHGLHGDVGEEIVVAGGLKDPTLGAYAPRILDEIDVRAALTKHSLPSLSALWTSFSPMYRTASRCASRKPLMMDVGWILRRTRSLARCGV